MSGWGQYPNSAYQQGGSQQTYSAQGQQQVSNHAPRKFHSAEFVLLTQSHDLWEAEWCAMCSDAWLDPKTCNLSGAPGQALTSTQHLCMDLPKCNDLRLLALYSHPDRRYLSACQLHDAFLDCTTRSMAMGTMAKAQATDLVKLQHQCKTAAMARLDMELANRPWPLEQHRCCTLSVKQALAQQCTKCSLW